MCGRMTLTRSIEEVARFFALAADEAVRAGSGGATGPRFNIAPSQPVLTLVPSDGGGRRLVWKRWGLVPAWAKDPSIGAKLFNARGETVDAKPSFRSAFARRRCLVVADGFYEWSPRDRGHRPFWIHPTATPLLAFAGLHEVWHGPADPPIETCSVITTEANADLAGIHARMPVVLAPAAWRTWLDAGTALGTAKALLVPAPAGTLALRPVSSRVNDPRRDDPGCLEPIDPSASGSASGATPRPARRPREREADREPEQLRLDVGDEQ